MLRQQQQRQQKQQERQDDLRRQESIGAAESGDEPGAPKTADTMGPGRKSVLHIGNMGSGGEGAGAPSGGKMGNNVGNGPFVDTDDLDGDIGREDDADDTEIRDIHTLTQRLRYAAVDRERIGAVKSFLRNGTDGEIARLSEHVST